MINSLFIGYVVIPSNIDRDKYVDYCFRRERINIQPEGGGDVVKNCLVSKNIVSELSFPKSLDQLGSAVVFGYCKRSPIILGVLNRTGDSQLLSENVFKKTVSSEVGVVSIEMKPEGGLFVNVDSVFEGESNINITLTSKDNSSKFNVFCQGDINIYSEGETSLETLKTIRFIKYFVDGKVKKIYSKLSIDDNGLVYEDKFNNKISANKDGKVLIHDGDSPAVRGLELQTEITKLNNRFKAFVETYLSTIEAVGAGGSAAKIAMQAMMDVFKDADFSSINSKKLFLK